MDKTNALSLTGGGMFDGGWTPVWLIKDEFTDTVAAGSVNGTAATPGPGTRTVTDTESKLSVGSGTAMFGKQATPEWGELMLGWGAQARAAGLAMIAKLTTPDSTSDEVKVGFGANAAINPIHGAIDTKNGWFRYDTNNAAGPSLDAYTISTEYTVGVLLRTAGEFAVGKLGGQWRLMWVANATTTATLYPQVSSYNGESLVDYFRVLQLPSPFDTDDGIATDVLSGSVSAGTTFTHEADCIIEATLTTRPTADNADIIFRQQDASNYWICRVNSSGDISLQEVVAGTPTQRSVAAGVVSSGHRIVVIAEGSTVKGYSNNTLRWTYSSASNFATATAGELDSLGTGGAVSDLKTWPRELDGIAASILNKASA